MAQRQATAPSRETGSRVPSKIVDKNTGKCYRTGKMLGKVRADDTLRSRPAAAVECSCGCCGCCYCECLLTDSTVFAALQGGFATAYQCTCVSSGEEKAVKVVARSSIRDSKSKQKVRAAPL